MAAPVPSAPNYQAPPASAPAPVYIAAAPPPAMYGAPVYTASTPLLAGQLDASRAVFRDIPLPVKCQFCGFCGPTNVNYVNGLLTWLAVGGICLFGGWCGCCIIPLFVRECKDVEHMCASCGKVIGKYERLKM